MAGAPGFPAAELKNTRSGEAWALEVKASDSCGLVSSSGEGGLCDLCDMSARPRERTQDKIPWS